MAQQSLFGSEAASVDAREPAPTTEEAPRLRLVRRAQLGLAVVDVDSLIPDDHPARLIASAVEHLDLRQFYAPIRARKGRAGRAATDPKLLVALWLYAAVDGVGAARELDRLTREHAAYRWLCANVSVNYHLLAAFRIGHAKALDQLLTDVISRLMAAELITVRRVAHDGMRVRAAAGASSFRRRERLEELSREVAAHVADLKASVHDPKHRSRRAAAQLRAAEDRNARVQQALAAMPAAEATKARQTKQKARAKAPRVSTTDPDARVMKMGDGGFRPAYNVQLSTDVDSRFIVGVQVATVGSDAGLLGPALADIKARTGRVPTEILVDGGFVSADAFDAAAAGGTTVYAPVPTPRVPDVDPHARKAEDSDTVAEWRDRMRTAEAKEIYKQRAATAETTNADLRCKRGLQQFVVRGATKALSVTLWAALAYNLLHAPLSALVG